jgi:hypothetical protein
MTATIDVIATLTVKTCPSCFIAYAAPNDLFQRHRDEGGNWYCPNGHQLHFQVPEVARLRSELEKAQRAAIEARDARDAATTDARNARAATKREQTRRHKVEARATLGVCLYCHRSFANVRRHEDTKHLTEVARARGRNLHAEADAQEGAAT